jgi:hypothetical protein
MADISVTAVNVALATGGSNATRKNVTYGEAVTQGQSVYLKSDGKWWKADSNATESAGSAGVGVALTKGSADDPGIVITGGLMNLGATLTAGAPYFVSSAAGGICPAADLSSTEYTTYLGSAISSSIINLGPHYSGGQTA